MTLASLLVESITSIIVAAAVDIVLIVTLDFEDPILVQIACRTLVNTTQLPQLTPMELKASPLFNISHSN